MVEDRKDAAQIEASELLARQARGTLGNPLSSEDMQAVERIRQSSITRARPRITPFDSTGQNPPAAQEGTTLWERIGQGWERVHVAAEFEPLGLLSPKTAEPGEPTTQG